MVVSDILSLEIFGKNSNCSPSSNRGIPYRRGYLLYGPPGTGKSSLSFAIAGYFKLKIYIVSLNSPAMNEENLSTLFTDLPKQCVVLLEDIDTAGLTHTRDSKPETSEDPKSLITRLPGASAIVPTAPPQTNSSGRISLSALLNILDGVASQEGRVLIMSLLLFRSLLGHLLILSSYQSQGQTRRSPHPTRTR